ncbi:MAG TPA: SMC family ATPase [Ktedonobacterales bacterium]
MRITTVELTNIKSYRRARIPLAEGTVAIRGHNGAGKSTIVEAIGFALFDAIPYDQAQFVREGEKSGTVAVSFLSALDDREYQVVRRCGANPTWYVYDAELRARVVEQKADVADFLRKHLRIESDSTLKDLFNDALGVPQGTFTADFLLTPANRKKKFDALLQVEDYAAATAKLNDTRNALADEQRAAQQHGDDLERETGQIAGLRERQAECLQRARDLTEHLGRLQAEQAEVEKRRDALDKRQREIAGMAAAAQVAAVNAAAAEARLQSATALWEDARCAAEVCEATRTVYGRHTQAQVRQAELGEHARERDTLAQRRAEAAQAREGAVRDTAHARQRLEEAHEAERQIVALQPAVRAQTDAERERDAAHHDTQQLELHRRAQMKATRERDQIDHDMAMGRQRIAELHALQPLADLLEERRERVTHLQDVRARRTERQKRLTAIAAEFAKLEVSRPGAAKQQEKARNDVRKIREQREAAEALPAREVAYAELDGKVRTLEARMEHHRLSRQQAGAGTCPFLAEPCLNIQRRGENSLATYFDRRIAEDDAALAPLRVRLAHISEALALSRKVRPFWEQLDRYEETQREAERRVAEIEEGLARLGSEQQEIADFLASAPGQEALAAAQRDFKQSDDADKQLREREARQAEVARMGEQRERVAAELVALETQIAALADASERLQSAEATLAKLGNPRSTSAGYERMASERTAREQALTGAEQREAALGERVAALDAALAPYAGLDDALRETQAALDATRDDATRYLQHEQIAAQVGPRATVREEAHQAASTAAGVLKKAQRDLARAEAGFDADELARVTQRAEELLGERGHTTAELRHTQEASAEVAKELARCEALLGDLAAAREEQETLAALQALLQQFRDTIKEAGPYVMRARLRHISTQANRIFGEVMGDRSAELAWQGDYEIVLKRDGKERSFAQLSGGEQMSAALAVRLALLRHLTRLDIAFFDEPTQNMDGERRGNLAEQIRRVRGFDQLIVISHDDTFEQGLDSVIHLEKRNGETMVVEEGALVPA